MLRTYVKPRQARGRGVLIHGKGVLSVHHGRMCHERAVVGNQRNGIAGSTRRLAVLGIEVFHSAEGTCSNAVTVGFSERPQ